MQLDIFDDSRDVMLRNDVIAALERRDADAAHTAWRVLASEFADCHALAPLDTLIAALASAPSTPFADHAALQTARTALDERIDPAAIQVFGATAAAAWTAPLWRSLAGRAASCRTD